MEGLTEGRIVHYVLSEHSHRPAIIVEAWKLHKPYNDEGIVNLLVFLDGDNDARMASGMHHGLIEWKPSVHYSDAANRAVGTWHWIERA